MKHIARSTIATLALLSAGTVYACQPPIPTNGFAQMFSNVAIGTVSSQGFVQRMPNAEPELLFKIKRLEILSGTSPPTVTAISPCGLPYQVGDRVVVGTFSGRRYAYPADYEPPFRAVHRRQR